MRQYSISWGRFLFIRAIGVGWPLQSIHVLDKGERRFRLAIEIIPTLLFAFLLYLNIISLMWFCIIFFIMHTAFYLLDSTWLVGFREYNPHFVGRDINNIIKYTDWVVEELKDCGNVEAITMYGSLCRRMYNLRSDYDLRIVQSKGSIRTYFKMIKLRIVGIWCYKIPLDLKLVDSVDFLKKEMRADEKPIVPFNRNTTFYNEGFSYSELKANPETFTKEYTLSHASK